MVRTCSAPTSVAGDGAEALDQRRVAAHRHVAGQRLDLDLGAESERAGAQRAIDLAVGVRDGLEGLAAHERLQAHVGGDDVHLGAAVGDDRMDADGVLVAEGLADGVDGASARSGRRRAR